MGGDEVDNGKKADTDTKNDGMTEIEHHRGGHRPRHKDHDRIRLYLRGRHRRLYLRPPKERELSLLSGE